MSNKNLSKLFVLLVTALVLLLPMSVAFAQDDAGGGTATLVGYCIGGIIGLALAFWTYQDANKRGANGIVWGLVVFFLGLIGLLIYWFVGRPKD